MYESGRGQKEQLHMVGRDLEKFKEFKGSYVFLFFFFSPGSSL